MDDEADLPHLRRARSRLGQTVKGKWRLERLLGVGGMAAVYAAEHRNGKRVALKWLHTELTLDRMVRERFLREGYIANRVSHPGVVSVLDDDVSEDGALILVMELLEGETVESRRRRSGGALPAPEILVVAHEVLDVLVAAHASGVVHRDLKPENLFLTRDGALKVLDFGIARMRDLSRTGATKANSSLGTPGFMPPEQARGRWQEVDARADLWALGATMFTLAAARHVHEATTVNEQLLAAMTQPAPPLASVVGDVPQALARVVDRALSANKEDRWADSREMQLAVREAYREIAGKTITHASKLATPDLPPGELDDAGPISETLMASGTPSGAREGASVPMGESRPSVVRRRRLRSSALVVVGVAVMAPAAFLAVRSSRPLPDPVAVRDAAMTMPPMPTVLSTTVERAMVASDAAAPPVSPPESVALPTPPAPSRPTVPGGSHHVPAPAPEPTQPKVELSSAPPPPSAPPPATSVPSASGPATDPLDRRR
ncbi:MAG TPA: protein kinase [Polyangiaceae bacterium]|jgi:serine/threonine-protein kinase